jgi:Protein of unknown function (DUF1812).
MEYSNSFDPQVPTVDVFFFDAQNRYLFKHHSTREDLKGNQLYLDDKITIGQYKVFTVGGLNDSFEVTDKNGNALKPGETLLNEIQVSLIRYFPVVSEDFSNLWVGEPITLNATGGRPVWRIELIKYTNRFSVELASAQGEPSGSTGDEPIYTFEIETPEGAVYDTDHFPLFTETVTYTPYLLQNGNNSILSVGEIKTVRLFDNDNYNFVVRNVNTQKILWEYNLIELLANTKPAYHPDGSILSMQEYLDRQSEWHIVVLYDVPDDGSDEYLAVGVQINNWIIWFNDIGV